ncbi:Copia protein [Termitomyces sp. T112]|nr:Copia protein [Termitomyces sp. T112]
MELWCILLHIAVAEGWDAAQIDMKTAFLYGILPEDEVQYMEQPEGFEEGGKEDLVCELVRGLYGMKQAGRIWNKTLNKQMVAWGFTRLAFESCIYYRKTTSGTVIAAVHIDDFLSIASSKGENNRFKAQMHEAWTISDLGTPRYILGIQKDAHPLSLPMEPGLKLRRPNCNVQTQEEKCAIAKLPYRSLVGCLLYIAVTTHPDIAYTIQQLSQFLDNYDRTHWNASIRLVRYLKGTQNLKLHLGGPSVVPRGFTDADWASCLDTRRSTGGYMWSLGTGAVSWAVHKQKTVATSSCEAKYMAAYESAQECIWLRMLLKGIGWDFTSMVTTLFCDNKSAIILSEDPTAHARVKHFDIKYHFIHERVQMGEMLIKYVNTKDNVADMFTKALPRPLFICL